MAESALVVCVPEAELYVAGLRERLDPAARLGVPAHVTLLYPFASPERISAEILAGVRAVASTSAAFAFRLEEARRFPGVLYLAPEPAAPFVALTRALARRFPEFPPYGGQFEDIVPHLTVAYASDDERAAAEDELRRSLPARGGITASCRALTLLENSSGRWRTLHAFSLQADGDPSPS